MSLKRRNTSSAEPEEEDRPAKRPRPAWIDEFDTFEHPTAQEQPRVDNSSGQQSAFPGLDEDNDELLYGDPEDGLQYLRMVRAERKNVPHILVAKRETENKLALEAAEVADDEDYHPDRAWIAAPNKELHESSNYSPDAQDLYYVSLLSRFAHLQTLLRTPPPLSTVELLTSSQPISFPQDAAKAREKWRFITKNSDPNPTQLACMDSESVMELVKLLTECMSGIVKSRVHSKIKRFGRWIWAALARCRDRGELSSEEIAELRELGKRAVQMLSFVRRSQSAAVEVAGGAHLDAVVDLDRISGVEDTDDNVTALNQAKAKMASVLETIDHEEVIYTAEDDELDSGRVDTGPDHDKHIRIVVDTTITIVGEMYGQRDLLEHRDIWDGQ